MKTYLLTPEVLLPFPSVRNVPNRDICLHGSLNSGRDMKEGSHLGLAVESDEVKLKACLPNVEFI